MLTPEERIRILKNNSEILHNKTVTCTKNALLSLMKEKAYADINMSEIIQRSGVSRGGVYNTYKSKDEILLDIVQEPIERVSDDEFIADATQTLSAVFDFIDFDDPEPEEYEEPELSDDEKNEIQKKRIRMIFEAGNITGIIVGMVLVLLLVTILFSMVYFVRSDITRNFTLFRIQF